VKEGGELGLSGLAFSVVADRHLAVHDARLVWPKRFVDEGLFGKLALQDRDVGLVTGAK
jgi:hypothetical protein